MSDYKNIVGTAFPPFLKNQLDIRGEKISAKSRDNQTLQYLTNRNAWIRLSSGADTKEGEGYSARLAQINVLQGGTVDSRENTVIRQGFNNLNPITSTYTQGSTDNLGFKPMPGIIGVSVGTGGKWQTLMQADIEIIAYDLDQLDTIQKLYMSLGCTVFLEWGHTNYFKNDGTFEKNPLPLDFFSFNSKEKILEEATKKRKNSDGNYECILGTVYNFDWSANNDGSYNCKVKIMGPGGMVESLRINYTANIDFNVFDQDNDSKKYTSVLANALGTIKSYLEKSGIAIVGTDGRGYVSRNFGVINNTNFFSKNNLIKNSKGNALSYADILNDIYSKCTYRGPQFISTPSTATTPALSIPNITTTPATATTPALSIQNLFIDSNKNNSLKYGNPWQLQSGYEIPSNLSEINPSLYYGYTSVATINGDNKYKLSYITFGHLMTLIQHLGIFTTGKKGNQGKGSNEKPIIYLDYNPENTIIGTGVLEASIDPSKCMVPWKINRMDASKTTRASLKKYFYPLDVESNTTYKWFSSTEGNDKKNFLIQKDISNQINKTYSDSNFQGKLFNILVNLDFAIKTLEDQSNNSEDKSVNLIEYINAILDGINLSLGKVNSFKTFFDDSSHCIRIIDENIVDRDSLNKNIYEIKTFGTQSIAYDYSFSSKVSPKLASQIVISTQQGGGISNFPEDVLSYQKLNADIEDRFSQTKQPSILPQNTNSEENPQDKKSLQTLFDHIHTTYSLKEDMDLNTISNLSTTYSDLQSRNNKFWSKTAGTILIPLEYNLTLDGISGILPYTAFKVPNDRLPKKYKDRVGFAVFSINHNFDNNQWVTQLRGQTLLLDNNLQEDIREVQINELQSNSQQIISNLTNIGAYAVDIGLNTTPQQGGNIALKPIKDILATFESGGFYGVANTGTAGRVSTIKVDTRTIGDLRTYWALPIGNPNRVFAMGRYQFIPLTLVDGTRNPLTFLPEGRGGILRGVGLKDKDLFSPANQEKIIDATLTTSIKLRYLGAYVSAANKGDRLDLERAIQDIGTEWASMPVIFDRNGIKVGDVVSGAGNSAFYGGSAGNPSIAKVYVLQMVKAVIKARENLTRNRPEFIPNYYN
jgi:hypothetical protein